MTNTRLAVLFPGIGYNCDRPLLYYAERLVRASDRDVMRVPYAGFPEKVRGNAGKLRTCIDMAQSQAETLLSGVRWDDYSDLLFVGKSIGTVVAARYAAEHGLRVHSVLLTPLEETFRWAQGDAIAFHGTLDPWAGNAAIEAACRARGIPLVLEPGANHSLETGDVAQDLQILARVMARIGQYLRDTDGHAAP